MNRPLPTPQVVHEQLEPEIVTVHEGRWAEIRSDFSLREVVLPHEGGFVPTSAPGVRRFMLDRIGGEKGRATSIVRFSPGSRHRRHVHPGGEEVFVIEGTFADEHGVYPAGTYLRSPPGSSHAPFSDEGCVLFVKLMQFDPEDNSRVALDSAAGTWRPGLIDGLSVLPLHEFGSEQVALVRWAPGTAFRAHTHLGGEEILVLAGRFEDEHGQYPAGTWIRSPTMSRHTPESRLGATILVKVGHLG